MPLTRAYLRSNIVLSKPVGLDFCDDVGPVHSPIYRIGDSESQRLCDIYLRHDSLMNSFAERVRAARKAAKLNQMQLAKKAGLSQTTISDIERGRNEGSRDVVALAKALKVSAEWLISGVAPAAAQDDEERQVMLEFDRVYRGSTDEGRAFLRNAIAAVESAFAKKDAQKKRA